MDRETGWMAWAVALVGAVLGVLSCAVLLGLAPLPRWLSAQEMGTVVAMYLMLLVVGDDPTRRRAPRQVTR